MVPVQYIGNKPRKYDNVGWSGLSWEPGQVLMVNDADAGILLAFPSVWKVASFLDSPPVDSPPVDIHARLAASAMKLASAAVSVTQPSGESPMPSISDSQSPLAVSESLTTVELPETDRRRARTRTLQDTVA